MERGSGKSGGWRCPNSPEDLELAEEGVEIPAELVDSESEEEDEMEMYELYFLRFNEPRQDAGIIAVPPPPPQLVAEELDEGMSVPGSSEEETENKEDDKAVAEEEDEENSLPGSSEEETESKEEDEAVAEEEDEGNNLPGSSEEEVQSKEEDEAVAEEEDEGNNLPGSSEEETESKEEDKAVAEEQDEEKSLPGSFEEEVESKEEDEAVVASPNLESSGELRVSLLKEELVEVEPSSSSTFSIQDIETEKEVPLGGDPLKSVVKSLDEVEITAHPNKNPFSSTEGICPDGIQDSGDLDSSPQPSTSKGAWLNGSLPLNSVDHSDEIIREQNNGDKPVEPEKEAGEKTRVVYIPKPDYSSLSAEKKLELRNQLARQIKDLQGKCKLGEPYQRRYAPDTVRIENGLKTIVTEDKDGVSRKIVFKKAECREADERRADPAYQLPPRPTPDYLEALVKELPDPVTTKAATAPKQEEKVGKFKGPAWDSEKDVDDFCKRFNDVFNKMAKESKAEKKAKEAARIEAEENHRNGLAAMLMEQGGRSRTRLATGAIARKVFTSKEVGHSSPQSCSTLKRQGRKRKSSQTETWRETELSPVPTLRRPMSPQPGPSVFRAPLPPPPPPSPPSPPTPPPTLPSSESGTSQCEEEGLPSPGEKDTTSQP